MKLIISVLFLTFNTAYAGIFKCKSETGNTSYQEAPCTKSSLQEKIVVQKFDPEITRQAIKRLDEELRVFNEAEIKRIESEKLKKTNEQPTIQVIEIHNETYKVTNPYNNHLFNDNPYYPTNSHQQHLRHKPTLIKDNRGQSFNPPGTLSRQSNMNPPLGR